MTRAERIAEALIRETQNSLRVDTRNGACAWFRVRSGYAQPLSLREVWRLASHRAEINHLPGSAADFAHALRLVQERVPILSEHEWRHTAPARKVA